MSRGKSLVSLWGATCIVRAFMPTARFPQPLRPLDDRRRRDVVLLGNRAAGISRRDRLGNAASLWRTRLCFAAAKQAAYDDTSSEFISLPIVLTKETAMSALNRVSFIIAVATLSTVWPMTIASSRADTDPAALVDALNAVFGKHDGFRAAHANGLCVKGSFTPSAQAAQLSKAPHLSGKGPFPVIGRFSMGGGDPAVPNTQKDNARGFALHIDLGKGATTDMVLLSAPIFLAKSPEQFLTLLQTVATKDGDKIAAFFKANPESTRQGEWLKARSLPASYASTSYYGVHAFTLVNAEGKTQLIKWKAAPVAGEASLTDDEAKAKAADFYTPELKERLAKGPADFNLTAILGEAGDPADDPTALWPDERKSVTLGTISITALEDAATCDAGMFDPANLTEGIEAPKNDTIFPLRSPAYAVSLSRRAK